MLIVSDETGVVIYEMCCFILAKKWAQKPTVIENHR